MFWHIKYIIDMLRILAAEGGEKDGRLPGAYSGTRFYVDYETLEKQLKAESLANAQGVTA